MVNSFRDLVALHRPQNVLLLVTLGSPNSRVSLPMPEPLEEKDPQAEEKSKNANEPEQQQISRISRAIQAVGNALAEAFKFDIGVLPTRNGISRLAAASSGAYCGLQLALFCLLHVTGSWGAYWGFVSASLTAEFRIVVGAIAALFVPQLVGSLFFGWLVSASSKDMTTPMTLFWRGFVLIVMLLVVASGIAGVYTAVRFGIKYVAPV